MAKKRKLAANSTPTSKSESEPESQSQPDPEPIKEDPPLVKEEPADAGEEAEADDAGGDGSERVQEEEEEEEEEAEDEDQKPLAFASNGGAGGGDEEEEEEDSESIQKILEHFPKDQLVEVLRDACANYDDLRSDVLRIADADPVHRKIFIHGLGWDANAKILTDFFSQYGEIEDCNAVTDKATGRSKGYAFILFKHRKGAQNALREPQKKIGGRITSCQMASAGPGPGPGPAQPTPPLVSEYTQRKIFVSNVGADVDPKKLLEFFSNFGEIEEGPLGLDKTTGKPRGFCLFVYKSIESAKKALEEPHKNFEGHVLHCQKAIDGPKGKYQYQYAGGKANFTGGQVTPAVGHLMAPPATGQVYPGPAIGAAIPGAGAVAGLNPAINQALTAILLGGLGSAGGPVVNQGVGGTALQGGYGGAQIGGYGGQTQAQGGYSGTHTGRGGNTRGQQGYGHTGGNQYMGHR